MWFITIGEGLYTGRAGVHNPCAVAQYRALSHSKLGHGVAGAFTHIPTCASSAWKWATEVANERASPIA